MKSNHSFIRQPQDLPGAVSEPLKNTQNSNTKDLTPRSLSPGTGGSSPIVPDNAQAVHTKTTAILSERLSNIFADETWFPILTTTNSIELYK